jgi:hypothetical protein
VRRAARTDGNQDGIVRALRNVGASVAILAAVGGGIPDLLVGFRGRNYLMEVKDPEQKPSDRRLTPDQAEWHALWRGQVAVVETEFDALKALGLA